jgi:hypothetical protein
MHEFSVSKDMKKKINNDKRRKEVTVRKVAAHLFLTLITKELKISVEHDRVVTTLKYNQTLTTIFRVVTNELVEFEKRLIEVQDFRKKH